MKSDEIIKVIDATCDKIGVVSDSAAEIMQKIARREITDSLFWIIVSIAFIVLSVKAIRFVMSKVKADSQSARYKVFSNDVLEEIFVIFALVAACAVLIIFICIMLSATENMVMWTLHPEASAIEYVLGLVGK